MTLSEFYANGYDAGYAGDDIDGHDYAPSTYAYYEWYAGYAAGAEAYDEDRDEEYGDYDDGLTDAEADAMTLTSIGWGTDEDYGYYGDDY